MQLVIFGLTGSSSWENSHATPVTALNAGARVPGAANAAIEF